ncbi:hypothetical protein SODALDRAFT_361718 [Sodiomyces alkalinus F11]|uniref:Uncharacterized protein n=1 Tax=Sodiomyces alkalinus (strain CBS 110278 / VKM F-3762 / F11) TaxID=1314773 RepID=A0A3N2PQZ9_SODAK|nr:hypothetical protein SODALDRAFT_361718 [Sodiomyces alkalinus F11]ROT36890.1 hypothetical protein SODALDRAFT_361718 [Sodiomyces alkalinus F11]
MVQISNLFPEPSEDDTTCNYRTPCLGRALPGYAEMGSPYVIDRSADYSTSSWQTFPTEDKDKERTAQVLHSPTFSLSIPSSTPRISPNPGSFSRMRVRREDAVIDGRDSATKPTRPTTALPSRQDKCYRPKDVVHVMRVSQPELALHAASSPRESQTGDQRLPIGVFGRGNRSRHVTLHDEEPSRVETSVTGPDEDRHLRSSVRTHHQDWEECVVPSDQSGSSLPYSQRHAVLRPPPPNPNSTRKFPIPEHLHTILNRNQKSVYSFRCAAHSPSSQREQGHESTLGPREQDFKRPSSNHLRAFNYIPVTSPLLFPRPSLTANSICSFVWA